MPNALENGVSSRRNGVLRSRANDVIDDFAELRKDIRRLADAATKTLNTHVRETAAHLDEARHDLQEQMIERTSEIKDDLSARARGGAKYLGKQVKARPGASIGVALGAGLIIGMLLAPRR